MPMIPDTDDWTPAEPTSEESCASPLGDFGCLYPDRCCMPGLHYMSECHTSEDLEAVYAEAADAEMAEALGLKRPVSFATIKRAFEIADECMADQLVSHAVVRRTEGGQVRRFCLVGSDCEKVDRLEDADPAIVEAYEWLLDRGLVSLGRDETGAYIELSRTS